MRLEEAVGQLICPTLLHPRRPFDEAAQLDALARYGWGGYIVFHQPAGPLAEQLAVFQQAARVPLLIGADMEAGAGQQAHGFSTFPTAMAFGAVDDEALAEDFGAWTAIEARLCGVNWVFAPVADVTNNPANPIIGVRGFGGDPARVGRLVAAFVRGCQGYGALACAKHFPGHGDTITDSHTRLGVVAADRARLDRVELPPFRAAIAAGVASLMSAHLALPALGVTGPATTSPALMTGLLREELGFGGLVVTDALGMGGITGSLDPLEAAVGAIAAGCDMLLMPPDPAATWQKLLDAVAAGQLPEARVREAAARVLAAKERLKLRPPAVLPASGPEEVANEAAWRALTLVRGSAEPLPEGTVCLSVDDGVEPERLAYWQQLAPGPVLAAEGEVPPLDAPHILVAVFTPIRIHKDRSLLPAGLMARLEALTRGRPTTVVSFSSPFVVAQFPWAECWVLAYGARPIQLEAAIAALKAGGPYPGSLPVSLPESLAPAADAPYERPAGPSFT